MAATNRGRWVVRCGTGWKSAGLVLHYRRIVGAQQAYRWVKLNQLIVGAAAPVVAPLQVSAAVTATVQTKCSLWQ